MDIATIGAAASLFLFLVWFFTRQQDIDLACEKQLYYELQEAKINYLFKIKHSRFPFFIKIFYFFCPFKLTIHDEDVIKWGTVVVVANNELHNEVYRVENVEIRRKYKAVKIVWPRGALIKREAKEILVEVSEHVSQGEIKNLIKTDIKETRINETTNRWVYKLKNESEAVIRDFELSLTEKVSNPKDIRIVNVRPAFATTEVDILLKGECSLDMIKAGQELEVNEIIWQLPKMEQRDEMTLIFEC